MCEIVWITRTTCDAAAGTVVSKIREGTAEQALSAGAIDKFVGGRDTKTIN